MTLIDKTDPITEGHLAKGSPTEPASHYLRDELYELLRSDSSIFDFLQSGSLDGVWYWDLEHPENEWMSERFWRTFGHDPADMPHRAEAWQGMIDADDLSVALDNFQHHCADPDHPYDQVVRYRHKSGSIVWVRCRGLAIRDEQGVPVRMLGAHTDITSTKVAEQRLAEKNEQLTRANAELARFAFAASHDLQNPIRALNGVLEALNEDHRQQLDEEGRKVLDMALRSARQASRLTEGILQYARAGNSKHDFAPVNCAEIVADIIADHKVPIEAGRVHFECGTLPTVQGLETPLRQVFQNLISNALKFAIDAHEDEPARIRIGAREEDEHWLFSIEDNGVGIDERFHSRIFDAFAQVHTQSEYEGVGLGLALCRQVVTTHGGSIRVESAPGAGTTFHFTLRRSPDVAEQRTEETP